MKKKRQVTNRDPDNLYAHHMPNLWDFFLVTMFGYLSYLHRGTWLGLFLAFVSLFLSYICIRAVLNTYYNQ